MYQTHEQRVAKLRNRLLLATQDVRDEVARYGEISDLNDCTLHLLLNAVDHGVSTQTQTQKERS